MSSFSSTHNCPICLDAIKREQMIYFHRANLSDLSTKVQEVFHTFHETCLDECYTAGLMDCALCREVDPEYEFDLAENLYNDQELSKAFADNNLELAAEIIKSKKVSDDRLQQYLFAAYNDHNLEVYRLILKNFDLTQDVLEDLFMEALKAQDKEAIKYLVANAELTPYFKEICMDYARSNDDTELKEFLERNSERLGDNKKPRILSKRALVAKVTRVALGVLMGCIVAGSALWFFFKLKWVGLTLILTSPFLGLGSAHLTKKRYLEN